MPSVVGLPVADGQALAGDAGLVLAQPDPDGPPLSALTWRRRCVITGQDPAPGTELTRWTSVAVTYEDLDDAAPAAVRAPRPGRPPAGHAEAHVPGS